MVDPQHLLLLAARWRRGAAACRDDPKGRMLPGHPRLLAASVLEEAARQLEDELSATLSP